MSLIVCYIHMYGGYFKAFWKLGLVVRFMSFYVEGFPVPVYVYIWGFSLFIGLLQRFFLFFPNFWLCNVHIIYVDFFKYSRLALSFQQIALERIIILKVIETLFRLIYVSAIL